MTELLKHPERDHDEFFGMVTDAPQMREFFGLVEKVARSDTSVLIRGETGTGKELVANAVHELSDRADKPFRAVNCATFTSELLASELFGHVRGAFTGAVDDRRGLFEVVDGGTIFLDEISEIPFDIQGRLLRVLEEQTFVPVGATNPRSVDVRLLSASNKALRRQVSENKFREDLMYRIRTVPIFLPPLVEREGDVELLCWHFIDEFNGKSGFPRTIEAIAPDAFQALLAYSWPGNVRELRNVVEYAFVIGDDEVLTIDELTPELRGEPPPSRKIEESAEADERRRILAALRATGGHRGKAAERLDISRTTLWRRMRELGLDDDNDD